MIAQAVVFKKKRANDHRECISFWWSEYNGEKRRNQQPNWLNSKGLLATWLIQFRQKSNLINLVREKQLKNVDRFFASIINLWEVIQRSASLFSKHPTKLLISCSFVFHRNCHILRDENEEEEEEDPKKMSKELVLETIRQKKETIIRLRSQPWSMKRKRRALKYFNHMFCSFS